MNSASPRPPITETPPLSLVLLPGLHGTDRLFGPLIGALPPTFAPLVISYPTKQALRYEALRRFVEDRLPTDRPFAILAESFSSPLAVLLSADQRPGLVATVLVGAFLTRPVGVWSGPARMLARPWAFRRKPPRSMIRHFLLGADASEQAVSDVEAAISEICPHVLAARVEQALNVDAAAAFQACAQPLLCIHAKQEKLLAPSVVSEMRRLRPDIEQVSLDAPHLILQSRPRPAASLIQRFVLLAAAAHSFRF